MKTVWALELMNYSLGLGSTPHAGGPKRREHWSLGRWGNILENARLGVKVPYKGQQRKIKQPRGRWRRISHGPHLLKMNLPTKIPKYIKISVKKCEQKISKKNNWFSAKV